jgi:hypothetical protein
LQQNLCLSELLITPPHISFTPSTYTNPIVLPNLTPPVDPDASKDSDENNPEDVPAAAKANERRVRAEEAGTAGTSSSMIASPAKSTDGASNESIS